MSIPAIQVQFNQAMDMVFDYFQRENPIVFYKSAAQEIVANDPSWNSDFQNPYAANIIKTSQSREVKCRILYFKDNELIKSFDGDENLSIRAAYPIGRVRIQVKTEDFEWLKDAKAFFINGEEFSKDSDWRGVGAFQQINRYEITLKKNQ